MYFPVAASAFANSTPIPCDAGSGRFDLIARHRGGTATTGEFTYQFTPVGRTDVRFPERAWLRSVSVVDWGGADALYINDDGPLLGTANLPTGSPAIVEPAVSKAFPVGEHQMGALMAATGFVSNTTTMVVDLTWSCEVDPVTPHFSALTGHESFIANLTAYGINHRFLFHYEASTRMLRIAPVGRLHDAAHMLVDSSDQFESFLPTLGVTLRGELQKTGTHMEIVHGQITYSDGSTAPVTVHGELLPPLP